MWSGNKDLDFPFKTKPANLPLSPTETSGVQFDTGMKRAQEQQFVQWQFTPLENPVSKFHSFVLWIQKMDNTDVVLKYFTYFCKLSHKDIMILS